MYASLFCFFVNDTATTEIYTYVHTLSLPDALPISPCPPGGGDVFFDVGRRCGADAGLNDHCRHRRRRIIITLTVIATGIRTERHGFGWRRHIIPMRRNVLAIYVAVEDRKSVV